MPLHGSVSKSPKVDEDYTVHQEMPELRQIAECVPIFGAMEFDKLADFAQENGD